MRTRFLFATLLLACPALFAQDGIDRELLQRAETVRATDAEIRFKQIPWITDVLQGFRVAKSENRPVFLYMITGDPWDDC